MTPAPTSGPHLARPYLLTTCAVFALIVLAHVWRVVAESRALAADPWFVATTLASAGLSVWAWVVARRLRPRSAAAMPLSADDPRAVALRAAIHGGDVVAMQRYLRDDPQLANARVVDDRGVSRTLLHVVADWPGHLPKGPEMVALLVAAGADVNARVAPGLGGSAETALHWAASSDDVAVLDALLDGGADLEAPGAVFTDGTPMSDAVVFAQWRAARRLLERGATTTLWQAAALGLIDRVRALCATDATPTPRDVTNAFWHACRGGQPSTAAELLGRGADLNWVGYDRTTPYDVAHESGEAALIDWLREHGARGAAELA